MASSFSFTRLSLLASRRLSPLGPRWLTTSASRWANTNRNQWIRQDKAEDDDSADADKDETPQRSQEEQIYRQVRKLRSIGYGAQESREMAVEMMQEADQFSRDLDEAGSEERDLEEELRNIALGPKPNKQSFWHDEDDPEMCTQEHDQFDEDDMTSMAHGKLDEVREMRHYARLIAWELPLLSKFAKPFTLPKEDQVLRWRYTTYMGESHPAQKKVVVQFAVDNMGLTPVQANKLRKLAGPRYDPTMDMIKMSCESFEFAAQNRRYLSDMVDKLMAEAKDPTDTFEDVPLDLRHKRIAFKPRFPLEWRLTDERRRQLAEQRKAAALAEDERAEHGSLVDGKRELDDFLARLDAADEATRKGEEKATQVDTQFPIPAMGGLGSGGSVGSGSSPTSSMDWMRAKSRTWSKR
ncbi:hypothetical protein L249_8851 [Ophiocordyceps polyrhachis-furcata BCC 54312]|uniref:Small ribosomal subunit protein mS35 mitochondrial conserved domain-containing protein n=1 Tax=Ophiocordyceps polyrhachis-furcata BCC 54312 TaxID=1330021 RepID=A0A367L1R8_9HYPO|nr:hypothetical protein L249_8851 [Ophiocordyceps polyrhachis-furcata BCC 54312]